MVRMSDVLKKIKEQSAKGPSQGLPSSESTPAPKAKSTPPAEPAGGKGSVSAEKKEARISPLAMAKGKVFSAEENVTFYLHAIAELKKFLEGLLLAQESVDAAPIESLVEKFITQISLGNNGLLELAFSPVPPALKEEDYLYIHMVNVGLFSIKVGLGLNYEAEELNNLACEAFFHDVGMLQYKHLYSQPRRLTPEEYDEIKKHPLAGAELAEKIKDKVKNLQVIIKQEHERADGTGYPQGLEDGSIIEHSQIIGLADIYEAMVHPRPYRDALPPEQVIKEVISAKRLFNHRILKVFFDSFSVYFLNSWVQLNSGEIGTVQSINSRQPFRPKVKLLFDSQQHKLTPEKTIDLTEHTNLYIKRHLKREEIKQLTGNV